MKRGTFSNKINSLQVNEIFKIGTYKFFRHDKYYAYNNNRLENDYKKAKHLINDYWFIVSILEEER